MPLFRRIFTLCYFLFIPIILVAQRQTREAYIEKYKAIAVQQMNQYGIPASIILAQGCLESGDGNSTLAINGNNHFGIKCHNWNGDSILHDDDDIGECFRKYKSAEESFRDHSEFLRKGVRYSSLFQLGHTDYKNWAFGLKAAGYATNPKYAQLLIDAIEKNKLYIFDTLQVNDVLADNVAIPSKYEDNNKSYSNKSDEPEQMVISSRKLKRMERRKARLQRRMETKDKKNNIMEDDFFNRY